MVLAAFTVFTLTSCASSEEDAAKKSASPEASAQDSERTARDGGTPTPAASPSTSPPASSPATPSRPALPEAADGTDVSACRDGTCEVRVRAPRDIPFDPETGIATLSVDSVSAEGVRITGSTTTGTQYQVQLFADPGGLATAAINDRFLIAALGVERGEAVVRVSPR